MKARPMNDQVFLLGAVDWDRRLFDSLIPLPDGTSYNAYLIKGSTKTALLDTVEPEMADVLMMQLAQVDAIDYVVVHHAEQDHSGTLPRVLAKYPEARVITTPSAENMLVDLLDIAPERIHTIKDHETLSLGDKTLEFISTPWVHWPETMVSYLQEDRILFSCDFFGSHLASSDMFVSNEAQVYEAAKRYYAEIMMPFRKIVRKNLDKVRAYDVAMIAPSHGQIYPDPAFILDAYDDWVSAPPKNIVVIPYVSMHNSTRSMVRYLVSALVERGVTVQQFDLADTDIGKLAISLVDAATIVIGTPTFQVGPHPLVAYAAYLANLLRPKARFASIIGSYGWGTRVTDQIAELIPRLDVELLTPVLCKGYPRDSDFSALDQLADAIAAKHQTLV